MRTKKILSMLLLIAMVLTLLPSIAVADSGTIVKDGITLTKSATLEADGTYSINLEAYATGETTTVQVPVPLDIVLVIDQSSSMGFNDAGEETSTASEKRVYKLRAAVNSFVQNIVQNSVDNDNVDHRIAVIGYAGSGDQRNTQTQSKGTGINGSSDYWVNTGLFVNGGFINYSKNSGTTTQLTSDNYSDALVSANVSGSVNTTLYNEINGNSSDSTNPYGLVASKKTGTHTYYGMIMANGVFAAHKDDQDYANRKRIVVLFTDGNTNDNQSDVIAQAKLLKSNYDATVYCVQLGDDSIGTFLSQVSSNYDKDGKQTYVDGVAVTKYSFKTTNSEELTKIFADISKDASESATKLSEQSVMKDVVASGLSVIAVDSDLSKATGATVSVYEATTTDDTTITKGDIDTTITPTATIDAANNTISITGFDYAKYYVAKDHAGKMIQVKITGILPDADTAVFGEATATNGDASGIYESADAESPAAKFAQPETIFTQHAYVIDYAKKTELDGLDQDVSITGIYSDFQNATENSSVSGEYGDATLSGSTVTYTPKTMQWDGYDDIYVFGKTSDESITSVDANASGYVWSKLSVIPANNVYYEDSFTTGSGTVGIVYNGNWVEDGTESTEMGMADEAIQGWITALADDTTYSAGSAHYSKEVGATATFTFTGTGVDIYSYTDAESGVVVARLSGDKLVKEDGSSYNKVLVVNNESVSGGYYQVPTLSWMDLTYGTYTVTINVQADADADKNSTYYLDGVRVYKPLSDETEADATVTAAYDTDELHATFVEVRNILLDSTSATLDDGAVFIDYVPAEEGEGGETGVKTAVIATYDEYGPENEVYLDAGQAIVFKVTGGKTLAVGMRAMTGTTAKVSFGDEASTVEVESSADMYYQVVANSEGMVEIMNNGSGKLAVTKIKYTDPVTITTATEDEVKTYAERVAMMADNPYYGAVEAPEVETYDPTVAEETEDEQSAVEETAVEVEITNPEQTEQVEQTATRDAALAFVRDLFAGIRNILGRR